MQTILGSGGAVGVELAKALIKYTSEIRLVSRNPQKVNETDELMAADLTKSEEIRKAVQGSSVVYVTVGFQYSVKVWQNTWPKFMADVIAACQEFNSKLVFFDNIYMYDPDFMNRITETTPINPASKKGKIRAQIAQMILDKIKEGTLTAIIARSADFYGSGIKNSSMLNETIIKPLKEGKSANLLSSANFKHSFTYTPDAGLATAMLGNADDAWNQVWHLPTASNPLTAKEWVVAVATELNVKPKFMVVSKLMVRIIGLFVPIMGELAEMMYQNDRDYIFDSDKFDKRFDFTPTSYSDGLRQVIQADFKP